MNVMAWADRHLERYGDYADALVTSNGSWSNGVLHERSQRLAAGLVGAGVRPNDRVVLWLPSGADLVVAFSAAVRAGAVAVLVGDSSPQDVLRRVLAHSGARALISARVPLPTDLPKPELLITTGAGGRAPQATHAWDDLIASHEPLAGVVERSSDDIAQIVYTSGTTGDPKGVVWTHGTVQARYEPFADTRNPALPARRSLCALPLAAAFGAQYLYLRLLQKMSLHLLERFTPEGALAAIAANRMEAAMFVPSMCEALLGVPGRERYDLKSLRSVLVGGAAVQPSLIERFREAFGVRVTTVYGLTELGPVARTTPGDSSGSVGKIREDMRIRIVDAEHRELPSGQIGEVEIESGLLRARYFQASPSETAAADDGWFRTGDVGYLDAAGQLWIVGRSKEIIIQGGANVYPQLVADVIEGLPGVLECAVVGASDPYLGEEVVACVVRDGAAELEAETVLARCRSRLDAKQLPARVLFLPALPRTDLGKVKIVELRAAVEAMKAATVETPLWRQLADVGGERRPAALRRAVDAKLKAILGRDDALDPERPLGELGLDSIGAVQLANSLSVALGRPISPTLAFNHPTVDAVCRFLGAELFHGIPSDPPPSEASAGNEARTAATGPIAIVGVGCRLPGNASSPARLWEGLLSGVDATSEIDRWDLTSIYDPEPGLPGCSYTKNAALVGDADCFDAEFFSMNRREATALDPQHRIALEATWHAIEDAGYDPRGLADRRVSVFLGIGSSGYESSDPIGSLAAMAPGRISHFLDLHGTALAVDTTCSSSLIAIELAVAQLRRGQSDVALAGGVNVICSAASFVGLSRIRALAADGRCKTFDAGADGFGRGEGCVMFVLKRLDDARRDGDRILALIRGVASNHDGRSSSLTAPNGAAQEAVIRAALRDAGVRPEEVDYLEAHGTGTRLGDPIEIEAAMRVFGGRSAPIVIGSVKSNIGHLEAAAGAAGVLKAALVVSTGVVPPNLHLRELNPEVARHASGFRIATHRAELQPASGRRRLAGVTSMGMSGTNAHVVLEEPPAAPPRAAEPEGEAQALCISARDEAALRDLTREYGRMLASEHDESIADICFTAAVGRSHFAHRLAVCGSTREELRANLLNAERRAVGGERAGSSGRADGVAFLFSGDAVDEVGAAAGLSLYAAEPAYRQTVEECAAHLGVSPEALLRANGAPDAREAAELGAAAAFATSLALARLLRAWGISPEVVTGQGAGEHAAACFAGNLDLGEALCRVVGHREPALQGAGAHGLRNASASLGTGASGGDALRGGAASQRGTIAVVATVDDRGGEDAVALARRAFPASIRCFVEIGFGGRVLDALRSRIGAERDALWLACRPGARSGRAALLAVLGELYQAGLDPAWDALYSSARRRRVALPTYPFQRKRYWHRGTLGKRARQRVRALDKEAPRASLRKVAAISEPRSAERVQATLQGLVARALGRKKAPPTSENLVDAGIDSLRAMELLADISRTFDVRLAPSDFNGAPTVAALAARILGLGSAEAPAGESGPRIVTVRGGAGSPLVCFHPAGGQVTAYMGLRGLVPGASSIVAVQSRAVDSNEDELGSLELLAEDYGRRLASLGHRSLRLFGWSLGGVIAHAVAHVLERQGVSVQGIGMADPPEPGSSLEIGEAALALTGIVYEHNPAPPSPRRLCQLVTDAGPAERAPRDWLALCEARGALPVGAIDPERFERVWRLYGAHARLIAEHTPRQIREPVDIWWAVRREGSYWTQSTTGPVHERLIGGSHFTIMRTPWVQSIAAAL